MSGCLSTAFDSEYADLDHKKSLVLEKAYGRER